MSPFHRHEQCKVGRLGDMPGVTGELVTELRLYHAVSNLKIDKVRALAGPCEGYFMCELDWAIGYLEVCEMLFWVYLWGCFWTSLAFESVEWAKQIALLDVGGPHPTIWRLGENRKAKKEGSGPAWLLSWGLGLFLTSGVNWNAGSFILDPESARIWTGAHTLLVTHLETQTVTTVPPLLGLQLANCGSRDFSASVITWATFLQ